MKLTDRIFELLEPTVKNLGYELYEVEFQKEYDNWVLTLFIDKEGGVDLDDCERVSNAVDPILDEADPIEQAYYLSVSSIGIDRPLKKDKDFQRNIGKKLDVRLYAPMDGKKEFTGELISFDAESFTVLTDKGEKQIKRKACALVRPHIDF
ncbi:MAG: ribosome maturation factor RimP [Clostridia bacterium]|nr:ribosome maturation factor RimP [Clostridia bacterium]